MTRLSLASGCALALAFATPALAQDAPVPQPQPEAQAPAAGISDAQLRGFAGAVVELSGLNDEYAPRLEAAGEAERPAIQQEAQQRAMAIVERHSLDAAQFNAIAQAAQQDPALAQRLDTYVRELAQPAG